MTRKTTKYDVGEEVRIKDDLIVGKTYFMDNSEEYDWFSSGMAHHKGKKTTIQEISIISGFYRLDIDGGFYLYTDEMLESIRDVVADEEYEAQQEVEELIEHMLQSIPEQLINHALDTGNKEMFMRLTKS